MSYLYGHFSTDGSEFIITDPQTPRSFDNFLWNESCFSNVQQTGVGYFDYQIGDTEAVQLLTGVGRICDYDVFGRDHLMSRLIYIRDNENGKYWNVNWEPVKSKYKLYECVHGLGYTIIRTAVEGIHCELRIFIPKGSDAVELWSLTLRNDSGRSRSLSVFVYNQIQFKFKWGFDSYGDMVYRSVWLNPELNAVVAMKRPYRKPHDHLMGFLASDYPITAYDGSRDSFVGLYNTLEAPLAVVQGYCTNTPGSADATIAAAQYNLELKSGQKEEISLMLGAVDDEKGIEHFSSKYFGNFEGYFAELNEEKRRMAEKNSVATPDTHFNRILNTWTKQAALFGASWCRWGYYGYRDIVQHGLGVSALQPERTKAILKEAMCHQYVSGLALRGWNPIDEKPYSDSALWLIFTLIAYLKETGDFGFLNDIIPFYDSGNATVLEHIQRVLSFFEANKGAHGLILIKYGDWNDSLTAVGKEGRGESVWLSQAYAEALGQMAELAGFVQNAMDAQKYRQERLTIISDINACAWDGRWYIRCFDDNGQPIGSHINKEAKIFFESQSWALISGIADEERKRSLIKSCDELLLTENGYRLLAPTFTEIDNNIGRISSMQPGVAENGTVYTHLNIWMILGLLKQDMPDRAYELFQQITPGYVNGDDDPKQRCLPYMFANCYFGPDHRNNKLQMEFSWITGSVAWFNTVLLDEMIGIKAEYDGLLIHPRLPSVWEKCEVKRHFRGSDYHIVIRNPEHHAAGNTKIIVDGKIIQGNKVPLDEIGCKHEVIVYYERLQDN